MDRKNIFKMTSNAKRVFAVHISTPWTQLREVNKSGFVLYLKSLGYTCVWLVFCYYIFILKSWMMHSILGWNPFWILSRHFCLKFTSDSNEEMTCISLIIQGCPDGSTVISLYFNFPTLYFPYTLISLYFNFPI